jgi:hypothetical protein
MLAMAFVHAAYAESLSQTALVGTWDTKTIVMLDQGKPKVQYKVDPRSFVYTFSSDGKWTMQGKKTKHNGAYRLQGSELILINEDGSTYQDWKADLESNGTSLLLKTDQLSFTLNRAMPTP